MSESRKTNVFQMIAMDTICPGSMLLRQWIRSGRRLHNICERPYVLHLLNGGRFYFIIIIIIVTRSRTIYSSPTYTKENLKHTERPELMKSNGKFKTDCKRKISGWSHMILKFPVKYFHYFCASQLFVSRIHFILK